MSSLSLLFLLLRRGSGSDGVDLSDDPLSDHEGGDSHEDDVADGGQQGAREDVEDKGIQNNVDVYRGRVQHESGVGGEEVGCCKDLEEEDRGLALARTMGFGGEFGWLAGG